MASLIINPPITLRLLRLRPYSIVICHIMSLMCRNSEHSIEDVLPACQTTLRNLQLDYLDLYLVHWPIEVKKGTVLRKFKEDEKLGYDPNRMAQCWEVGHPFPV